MEPIERGFCYGVVATIIGLFFILVILAYPKTEDMKEIRAYAKENKCDRH